MGPLRWPAILLVATSCSSTPVTIQNPAVAADVAAFKAEMNDCVSGSADRAQMLRCFDETRARWCGPAGRLAILGGCGDAGAIAPADAGGQ